MKKLLTLALLLIGVLHTQTAHQVILTWTDPNNPQGTQYNVYRQTSACPAQAPTTTDGFTKINLTPVSGLTYVDTPVQVGVVYCYLVTAASGTVESGPSPDAGATPLPFSPVTLQITVK
ncbi:MAG: hypothetical protein KGI27_09810 [Thaumarchaeota archaeon]|nr:hypothetical protein [Nitrososphaerota archaeon]